MIHPGLSPLIFATTKTLQSVNGRFEPGPGPQRTTKRVSLAGSYEAAPIMQDVGSGPLSVNTTERRAQRLDMLSGRLGDENRHGTAGG